MVSVSLLVRWKTTAWQVKNTRHCSISGVADAIIDTLSVYLHRGGRLAGR